MLLLGILHFENADHDCAILTGVNPFRNSQRASNNICFEFIMILNSENSLARTPGKCFALLVSELTYDTKTIQLKLMGFSVRASLICVLC